MLTLAIYLVLAAGLILGLLAVRALRAMSRCKPRQHRTTRATRAQDRAQDLHDVAAALATRKR